MKAKPSNVIDFATMTKRPMVAQQQLDDLFGYFEVCALRQRYAGQRVRIVDSSGTTYGIIWDFFNVVDHYHGRNDRLELGVIYTGADYELPPGTTHEFVTIKPLLKEITFDNKITLPSKHRKEKKVEVLEYIYFKA